VAAGCKMLMGVTYNNAGLRFRFCRADLMAQLVKMGLLMLRYAGKSSIRATAVLPPQEAC
jgi:hypothetical protein